MSCVVKGYEAEVEQEQELRNLAYLDQPEIVLGEPLRNITPHLLAILSSIKSPFYVGGVYTHAHVAQFLWALHSEYDPKNERRRKRLVASVSKIDLKKCHDEIADFLKVTFMDAPTGGKEEKPIAANIAWMVYRFRHEPWRMSEAETKNTPLRKLYQELRCFSKEQGESPANRSDILKGNWIQAVNDWIAEDPVNHQRELDAWNARQRQ